MTVDHNHQSADAYTSETLRWHLHDRHGITMPVDTPPFEDIGVHTRLHAVAVPEPAAQEPRVLLVEIGGQPPPGHTEYLLTIVSTTGTGRFFASASVPVTQAVVREWERLIAESMVLAVGKVLVLAFQPLAPPEVSE